MSYFCTAMVSAARRSRTRSRDARRLRTPVGAGSFGLSGKTSNSPRPTMSSRLVIVACRYASFTPAIIRSGVRIRNGPGAASSSRR